MSREISYDFLFLNGFRQLGSRPIWSNHKFQLHQYPEHWGVFKRGEDNVIYRDTGISVKTETELTELLTNNKPR